MPVCYGSDTQGDHTPEIEQILASRAWICLDLGQLVAANGYHYRMDQFRDYATELRSAYLFSAVSDEHLQSLIRSAQQVRLETGEMLFSHGQRAERFFFLREGLMKLFRVSAEGDEKIIEVTQPGQTFAEAVLFMGNEAHYPVSAQAIHESRLFAFHYTPFRELLTSSTDACFGMLASLSRRLHMLVNQIESLTLQSATYRLIAYLLEQIPRDVQESPEVLLTTPKGIIAAQLAMQPETLSRILAKLRSTNLIDVHANHIILRDVQALRDLIHQPPPEGS